MNLPRITRKIVQKYLVPKAQLSYSQFGEDLIMSLFFNEHGITKPIYLDIGANEPKFISNSFYFYQKGSRGVLIEPNPLLCTKLRKQRAEDKVLNVGIGFKNEETANFYLFPDFANGLSTFSEKEAMHWQNVGMKGLGKIPVEKVIKMPLLSINDIFEEYFSNKVPDFISLDVEGLDLEILKSMNFEKYRPYLICVETMMYNEHQASYKTDEISNFMFTKNYSVYADTRVNTIFCRNDI